MAGAAAIIIRREKELVNHFRQMNALTPASAQSTNVLQVDENIAFRILRDRAIIRETSPGLYYLDELSWEASRRLKRRLALVLLAVVIVAGVSSYFATARG